uniref:Cytochrome c oxidase assembly factor 5 n=1 Tax=Sus scrofa TaxID=9823 RepID=A0A8D0I1B8_PIG
MPRYYEDKPEGGACAGVKEDLGACLLQSDCVLQTFGFSSQSPVDGGGALKNTNSWSSHCGSAVTTQLVSMRIQEGKSPRQCLKEGSCKALQYSFFECKRSMLDARSRFRGRKGY